jgi:ankyrin repeat protein
MLVRIDLDHPKRQLQMKDSKAGLATDPLSDDRRSGRIDAANSHIKHASPGGRLHEKGPHDIDTRIDHGGWTAHIGHRRS